MKLEDLSKEDKEKLFEEFREREKFIDRELNMTFTSIIKNINLQLIKY